MTNAKLITAFLSKMPPMKAGILEDAHDMLVGARDTIVRRDSDLVSADRAHDETVKMFRKIIADNGEKVGALREAAQEFKDAIYLEHDDYETRELKAKLFRALEAFE